MNVRFTHRIAFAAVVAGALAAAPGCGTRTIAAPRPDDVNVASIRGEFSGKAKAGPTNGQPSFKHDGGWVNLSGRFRLIGTPAPFPAQKVDKDHVVCAPGGVMPQQHRLLVNSTSQGIANVVVFVEVEEGAAIPLHEAAKTPPAPEGFTLDQKACIFLPHVLAVHSGMKAMPVKNSDPVLHNTNIPALNFNASIPAGGSATCPLKVLDRPGAVSCSVHPWMDAFVLVRGNGYYAVTDGDGKFEIKNLPSGDRLTLHVWHEVAALAGGNRVPGFIQDITVNNDKIKAIRKGFTVTLEKDKPLADLDFQIPAKALGGS